MPKPFDPSALLYIDFYSDPYDDHFPKLSDLWLQQADIYKSKHEKIQNFLTLNLYDIESDWSMYDADLEKFSWKNNREQFGHDSLSLAFRLRSHRLLTVSYTGAQFVIGCEFDPGIQALYIQAIGFWNNKFRHEFSSITTQS